MSTSHYTTMREIAKQRIHTVDILMAAEDYESAAYLIGLTGLTTPPITVVNG